MKLVMDWKGRSTLSGLKPLGKGVSLCPDLERTKATSS